MIVHEDYSALGSGRRGQTRPRSFTSRLNDNLREQHGYACAYGARSGFRRAQHRLGRPRLCSQLPAVLVSYRYR